jgi:RNA recognition motif-containing protein
MSLIKSSRNEPESSQDYLDTKIGEFNKDPSVATIYIGNLDYEFDELSLKELFEEYGFVNYVKLIKDKNTQKSKGIAFIQMSHLTQAKTAINELNESTLNGRQIKVSIAKEQEADRVVEKVAKVAKKRRKPYKAYFSKADRALEIETKQ